MLKSTHNLLVEKKRDQVGIGAGTEENMYIY